MRDLTLVFDLDGTLVDTAPDLVAATNHVLDHVGLAAVDAQSLRPYIGHGARVMIERATAGRQARRRRARAAARALPRLLQRQHRRRQPPIRGRGRGARAVPAAGAKLAVCTNKREGMSRQLLDTLDLSRFFAAIAGATRSPAASRIPSICSAPSISPAASRARHHDRRQPRWTSRRPRRRACPSSP